MTTIARSASGNASGNASGSAIKALFTPDHNRYEGVRPINIYLLRVLYLLMFVGVAIQSWAAVLNHHGPWRYVLRTWFRRPAASLHPGESR